MGLDLEELSKILDITTENWKNCPNDDYYTFQFIGGLLDLLEFNETGGCLSDNGRNILLYHDLNKALKAGNETEEQKKEVFKATLYLFTGYTLCCLFIGFRTTKGKSNSELWDKIPEDYAGVIDEVYDAIVPKMKVYKGLLQHLLLSLDEYYAKLFNSEKRVVFNRDMFENKIVVDDEEHDEEMDKIKKNAVEVKS
jgi:hypothetical protein